MRLVVTCTLLLSACDRPPAPPTVFAASSLREVVAEIAGPGGLRAQCDASSTLARQLRAGARADLFITAAPEWLEGIPVVERFDWLANRLVCVVPRGSDGVDLRTARRIALALEQVPAGRYAAAALRHAGVDIAGRAIYGSSARDVLSKVAQGGADAGVVYATDAAVEPDVRVAFVFPEESHPRILYTVAVLSERGRDLARSLRSPRSLEIARRHGFEAAP
jgi:molybdate transport system substrate-binding protein